MPVPTIPTTKKAVDNIADFLISRSTKGPKTAADKPKNKIAIENAHSTLGTDCPMLSAIACLKTLQAYTVPILP